MGRALKELEDRLIELRLGAEMMLEPALNATGTFKRYAEEVKRIANGRSTIMTAAITTFIFLVTLFGALFILWGVWTAIMGVYDEFSQRKRKAMATPMQIDELMLRRLKRSVATRIETIRLANKS